MDGGVKTLRPVLGRVADEGDLDVVELGLQGPRGGECVGVGGRGVEDRLAKVGEPILDLTGQL